MIVHPMVKGRQEEQEPAVYPVVKGAGAGSSPEGKGGQEEQETVQ